MGKKKSGSKDSYNDTSQIGKAKSNINGTASEQYSKTSESSASRPCLSCSAFFISFVLVALLSISVGLILIEINVISSDKVLYPSFKESYIASEDRETTDKGPTVEKENIILEAPVKHQSSNTDSEKENKETVKEMDSSTSEEPPRKKIKPKETVPDAAPDVTAKEAEQLEKTLDVEKAEKLADIEKQIITEKPPKPDSVTPKPSTTGAEDPSKAPKKSSDKDGDKPVPPARPDDTRKKETEISLADLYMEVESIADDILQEDPENYMVKQLAPHLEGVLKNLEGGKESGLRESLLHIKTILIDLKQRLDEARNAKLPKDSTQDERIPVDEVIPDPVYIAPRGKEGQEKEGKTESGKKSPEKKETPKDKPSGVDQRVPVNEVVPDPVYIAPLGKEEGVASDGSVEGEKRSSKIERDAEPKSKDLGKKNQDQTSKSTSGESVKTDNSKKSVPEAKTVKESVSVKVPVQDKTDKSDKETPRSKEELKKEQSQEKLRKKEQSQEEQRKKEQSQEELRTKENQETLRKKEQSQKEKQRKEEVEKKRKQDSDNEGTNKKEKVSKAEASNAESRSKKDKPASKSEKDEQFEENLRKAEALPDEVPVHKSQSS